MASPLGTAALERSCANSTALCNILTAAVLIVFGRDLLIPEPAGLPLARDVCSSRPILTLTSIDSRTAGLLFCSRRIRRAVATPSALQARRAFSSSVRSSVRTSPVWIGRQKGPRSAACQPAACAESSAALQAATPVRLL